MGKKKKKTTAPKKPTVMADPGRCNGEPVEEPPGEPLFPETDGSEVSTSKSTSTTEEASEAPPVVENGGSEIRSERFKDSVGRVYVRQDCGKLRRDSDGMLVDDDFTTFTKS